MDEDWHAICQVIHKSVEGAEWENTHYKCVERTRKSTFEGEDPLDDVGRPRQR